MVGARTSGYPFQGEQSHTGFLESNGHLFPVCPPHQSCADLLSACLSLHDAGSKGEQSEVVSIGRHVRVGNGTVRHKVVKDGWGDDGSLWNPRTHLTGRRKVSLIETRYYICLPAAEVCHKPSNQIVGVESGGSSQ